MIVFLVYLNYFSFVKYRKRISIISKLFLNWQSLSVSNLIIFTVFDISPVSIWTVKIFEKVVLFCTHFIYFVRYNPIKTFISTRRNSNRPKIEPEVKNLLSRK